MREEFFGFVKVEFIIGEVFVELFFRVLREFGISVENMVGQGYDGVLNMRGCCKGV